MPTRPSAISQASFPTAAIARSSVLGTNRCSVALFLVLAVGLLSLSTIQSSFSSWPISMSRAPLSTGKAAPSAAPSPCTSVWDLRRPDGTEYPHNQLRAAAAALAAPEEANSQDNWQQGSPQDGDGAGGEADREAAHPREEGGNGRVSSASYPGGGRAVSATAGPQAEAEGGGIGVRRTLADDGGVGAGWHAHGYAQGGADGVGMSAWVGAIGLAAVAFVVVLVKGLFGIGGTSPTREPPSVSLGSVVVVFPSRTAPSSSSYMSSTLCSVLLESLEAVFL